MYCRDLGFEGKVVLQYWLQGVRLCHNTVHCIVTEARQGLYCNTVTVPTIQQGHGRWACRWALGERACWACRARARLGAQALGRWGGRRWGAGARGRGALAGARARGAGGSGRAAGRTGARRWADWAQARGACAVGAGSVRGIGRQGARLGAPGVLVGPVGGSCTRLDFQTGFSTQYFS